MDMKWVVIYGYEVGGDIWICWADGICCVHGGLMS
jgi:hypothetical protein